MVRINKKNMSKKNNREDAAYNYVKEGSKYANKIQKMERMYGSYSKEEVNELIKCYKKYTYFLTKAVNNCSPEKAFFGELQIKINSKMVAVMEASLMTNGNDIDAHELEVSKRSIMGQVMMNAC